MIIVRCLILVACLPIVVPETTNDSYEQYLRHNVSEVYSVADVAPFDEDHVVLPSPNSTVPQARDCEEAKIRCTLRKGCRIAFQLYLIGCADLMSGRSAHCDEYCRNALVGLISTDAGQELINCRCSDDFCRQASARVEVCREEVLQTAAKETVVPCSVAYWMCSVDTSCGTALVYYERLCRRMFDGRSCSPKCNNSISILQRQEMASKLESCECQGNEEFDCVRIKENMARLCFSWKEKKGSKDEVEKVEDNEVDSTSEKEKNGRSEGPRVHPWNLHALLTALVIRWSSW